MEPAMCVYTCSVVYILMQQYELICELVGKCNGHHGNCYWLLAEAKPNCTLSISTPYFLENLMPSKTIHTVKKLTTELLNVLGPLWLIISV